MLQIKKLKSIEKTDVKKVGISLSIGLLCALCARTSLFGATNPYAVALIAAALSASSSGISAIILGTGVGLLSCLPASLPDTLFAFPAILALLMLRALRKKTGTLEAMAVILLQLLSLPFRSSTPYGYITGALEIAMACILYFPFRQTFKTLSGKEVALPGEESTISLVLSLAFALLGTAGLNSGFFSFSIFLACFFSMGFAILGGPASGAAAGAAMGVAVAAIGGDPLSIGYFSLFGLFAGVFRSFKRPGLTLSLILCNFVALLLLQRFVLPLPELLFACALILLLPPPVWAYFKQMFDPSLRNVKTGLDYGRIMQEAVQGRLSGCSRAFSHMADALDPTVLQKKEIQSLTEKLAAAVCTGCPRCDECWAQSFTKTYLAFEELSSLAFGSLSIEPHWLYQQCEKKDSLFSFLKQELGEGDALSRKRQLFESKALAARQLRHAGKLMDKLSQEGPPHLFDSDLEQQLAEAFALEGVRLFSLTVKNQNGLTLELSLPGIHSDKALPVIETVCGKKMEITDHHKKRRADFITVREERRFLLRSAGETAPADGRKVCGDSISVLNLSDHHQALILCDGMGNGEAAAAESSATVKMLEHFLVAGYDPDFILDSVNRLLLLKDEENYTTVDLCIISACNGHANFIKVGAAPSYIVCGDDVQRISASTLPIGILDDVAPSRIQRTLSGSEYIYLMSDGITDCAGEQIYDWLRSIRTGNCKSMAKQLIQKAQENGAQDDLSVIVCNLLPRNEFISFFPRF
ncbi:MAG: SpoIIE family protein phosphatase [Christensenellales bacterium]|jgi:stage II sporulation protein E